MDFSVITDYLVIGKTPRAEAYHTLRKMGVKLVINMRWERRPYPDVHEKPIPALWLPTFDSPIILVPVHVLLRGVRAALPIIEERVRGQRPVIGDGTNGSTRLSRSTLIRIESRGRDLS